MPVYQMCGSNYALFLFVLSTGTVGAEEDTALCEMLGSPQFPLLSKDGDINIGGVFSIHSQISKPPLSFTDTPEPLMCSRYSLPPFSFICFQTEKLRPIECEKAPLTFQNKFQTIPLCPDNDFCH